MREYGKKNTKGELNSMYKNCKTCKLYAKTPAKPVVALPMARYFNEKVAIDLKILSNGRKILQMLFPFHKKCKEQKNAWKPNKLN